jgi:cell division septation protein DedD
MLEIQEDKNIKTLDSQLQGINEDWKKYNKRLDNLLDDVQIKTQLETEKKVRTKNSKLPIISAIGIVLLVLIYIQNKQFFNLPRFSTDHQPINKRVTFTSKNGSPLKPSPDKTESINHEPTTNKNKSSSSSQTISSREGKTTSPTEKQSTIQAISEKKPTPAKSKEFFVQVGAFSIKANATKLAKKLNSKGFKTEIYARSIKSTKHQVSSGNFIEKADAASSFAKFKSLGFNPSIKKSGAAHVLELGLFTKELEAITFTNKLKKSGFKHNQKIVMINRKMFIVRTKDLATEGKARQTKTNLIKLGLKNSFIQFPLNP